MKVEDVFIDASKPITPYETFKMVLLAPVALVRLLLLYILCQLVNFVDTRSLFRAGLACVGFYHIPMIGPAPYSTPASPPPRIIVYNHICLFDGLIITLFMPTAFLTTIENKNHPFTGPFFKLTGSIFITPKKNTIDQIIDRVNDDTNPYPLAIAPEGTVSAGKALLKFKSGAFIPLKPVQPVLLRYPNKHLNMSFTKKTALLTTFRILTQFVNYATIEFLQPVSPLPGEGPQEFAERTRSIMATALNVPMVPFDLDSKRRLFAIAPAS